MEQGPTRTSKRGSRPLRMLEISVRELKMVAVDVSVMGRSSSRKTGGRTTLVHLMRRSSIFGGMGRFLALQSLSDGRNWNGGPRTPNQNLSVWARRARTE